MRSAAIDEFAADQAAVDHLTSVALYRPQQFDHELAALRATAVVDQARAGFVRDLEANGYHVRDEGYIPWGQNITNLVNPIPEDEGGGWTDPLTDETHASCPGRMVTIDLGFVWPRDAMVAWMNANPDCPVVGEGDQAEPAIEFDDDVEAMDAGMVPSWHVSGQGCVDPGAHGHVDVRTAARRDHGEPVPISANGDGEAPPQAETPEQRRDRLAAEEADREAAARAAKSAGLKRVKARNILWRAATPVRREHVARLVTGSKLQPPKESGRTVKQYRAAVTRFRAMAICRHQTTPEMASFGHRVAAVLLALGGNEWSSEDYIAKALDEASPERC
jgi:hypothetical protein